MTLEQEKLIWEKLLSCRRISEIESHITQKSCLEDPRNPFERDSDRIVYSYPFRRLQDKTQVIPLPVIDFVHTRLTHSIEVSTVGRSLGRHIENFLLKRGILQDAKCGTIPAIVSAACQAHDIGNPPFGHSGEDAISEYFKFGKGDTYLSNDYKTPIQDASGYVHSFEFKDIESEVKIRDLVKFEGNAMGFRILTKYDNIGLDLTCATLATFSKYPRQSFIETEMEAPYNWNPDRASQKKYGFFYSERDIFKKVAEEVGLVQLKDPATGNYSWTRHPLAFIMEAADDICYRTIDLEDGFRVGRINFKEAEEVLMAIASKDRTFSQERYNEQTRDKQKFSYLRTKAIGYLMQQCVNAFIENYEDILLGNFDRELLKSIADKDALSAVQGLRDVLARCVYKWENVLALEAAGFEVLGGLLHEYIEASNICIACPPETRSKRASKIFDLLSEEYRHIDKEEKYLRYIKIVDYVSGMTDGYALNIYRKIKGIIT